jgi:hypothetical protein
MEGAASITSRRNSRARGEVTEKNYPAHIRTSLDAAAINVMRPKKKKSRNKAGRTELKRCTGWHGLLMKGVCKFVRTCPMIEKRLEKPRGRGGMADAADLRKT